MQSVNRKEHVKRLREKRTSRQEIYMQMSKNSLQNTHWFEPQKIDIHNILLHNGNLQWSVPFGHSTTPRKKMMKSN